MELAMANGFSAVGFTELNEQEMLWVDGGDFGDFLNGVKTVCKGVIATAVDYGVGIAVGAGVAAVTTAAAPAVVVGVGVDLLLNIFDVGDKVADFLVN